MLELSNVKKYYEVGDIVTKALDGVSLTFKSQEFVAILGTSGSGKTTLLNVIGGLDTYDSGDLIINGQSTKEYKDSDWDAYRNNTIGFVFQSYNLISHLGIVENVELGMTLSGVSKETKRRKATEALERVGLGAHLNKKPNQLSGGQMQRVAIARALANDPDILLCDEPTGALDTETSAQIMDLIQSLSKEKLVIMVTHNPELAREYASRIVRLSDGELVTDSAQFNQGEQTEELTGGFELKHTKMSFLTALNLSFNNLLTKKGRTFLTALASSIGIISIAIVLSLSNGFQFQIDQTQAETVSQFPIVISQIVSSPPTNVESPLGTTSGDYPTSEQLIVRQQIQDQTQHVNLLDTAYIDYIEAIDPSLVRNIGYSRPTQLQLLREKDGEVTPVVLSNDMQSDFGLPGASAISSMLGVSTSTIPITLDQTETADFLTENYDLLTGSYAQGATDLVLVVDSENQTNMNALANLGFEVEDGEEVDFEEVIGTEIKLVHHDDYYQSLPTGQFVPGQDFQAVYDAENNQTLTITGVVRAKPDSTMAILAPGIAYYDQLLLDYIEINRESEIVTAQQDSETNVLTGEPIDASSAEFLLGSLGGHQNPSNVMLYPSNYESKESVLTYLDDYNTGKEQEDKVIYSDLAGTMTELTGGLMDAITYVLVAFAAISLVTSMIMIGIITYTSVMERTKEIGVLKALGARKKDITRVFDAETFILGIGSGALGVVIAYLATFPINAILYRVTDLKDVARLDPMHALMLIVVSTILTVIGGHIPARIAAKKDAAIALRAD